MSAFVSKYWEWGYRGIMLLGLGITLGTVKASFMNKQDVAEMIAPLMEQAKYNGAKIEAAYLRVGTIETTLAVMAEQQKAISRGEDNMRDMEKRLRELERETRLQGDAR